MKKSLVLTGMMGVGKSTIGSFLSKRLKMKFVDIDKVVEKNEKLSINDIFKIKGEPYFRSLEEKITLDYLNKKNLVISLGGGAFMNPIIRAKAKRECITFWLDSSIIALMKRSSGANKRPLINMNNIEESLTNIYKSRKKTYQLADHKVDCSKFDKSKIIDNIIKIYESN